MILWGKQCERRKREALRWRGILPRMKRMCAVGDAQMAEAKYRQEKERLDGLARIEGGGVEEQETLRN